MTFTIYSKTGCPYCSKIEQILDNLGMSTVVYTLNEHFTREEFYSEFGHGSTFPQVVHEDKVLGGATDTIEYLKEQNLCCQ